MERWSRGTEPILLVEDKDSLRTMLRHALEAQGYSVIEARDETEARTALGQSLPAVVLSDLRLPAGDGFGVLRAAKDADPDLPVIVMTAYGSIQDAVSAMKDGALDFLAKPVDPDHLLLLVERALAQRRLLSEYNLLKEEAAKRRGRAGHHRRVGRHSRTPCSRCSARLAPTRRCCSKARAGPARSCSRGPCTRSASAANGPFVAINCAAIPGHAARGRAVRLREGRVHRRDAAQARQVRAGPARHAVPRRDGRAAAGAPGASSCARSKSEAFERLGGTAHRPGRRAHRGRHQSRHFEQAVAARQFREDLYFRLSVFPITIPPLRERTEDIPLLARHFIERDVPRARQAAADAVAERRWRRCTAYPWPGNVRELQNCLERAVILADGDTILPGPSESEQPCRAGGSGGRTPGTPSTSTAASRRRRSARWPRSERREIRRAVRDADGDKGRAADRLQIGYRALLGEDEGARLETDATVR